MTHSLGSQHRCISPLLVAILASLVLLSSPEAQPVSAAEAPRPVSPEGTILFSSLAPRGWDLHLTHVQTQKSRQLTKHPALDYNASFSLDGKHLAFVSERDGNLELYRANSDGTHLKRLTHNFALDDHPTWSPDSKRIAFCSTRMPARTPGKAWNAIYVMNADGTNAQRISPRKSADYSPAWSPQGDWIACASGSGEAGETDLYIMKPNGEDRKRVVKNGGWPTFSGDGKALYFHSNRKGKWGIWRIHLDGSDLKRITPTDIDAFTPRTSADGQWLVMVMKRNQHRQIARLNLATQKLTPVTTAPTDHWNPCISPDGHRIVYHRTAANFLVPNVELWGSPRGFRAQMLRLAGAFPAISPEGKRVALVAGNFSHLDVMNMDGSNRKNLFKSNPRSVFSLSWAHQRNRIAFSHGTAFQGPRSTVNIETVAPDGSGHKALTAKTGNNAFPSFSPDGKRLAFRSGRSGSKNLYIMDLSSTTVTRLTKGKWTDTMVDWSPTGKWITFASNRDRNFEIWLIRPDGTGLKKLIGGGGRNNHPHFSPDGQWIVFTSQRAGYSAEEISLPHQPQPYGDLFAIRTDGTGLVRLTHNGFEEGTPAWGAVTGVKPSKEGKKGKGEEY